MKKKYAMIPINYKEDSLGNLLVRRVLVSYLFKTHKRKPNGGIVTYYHGTKFVFADNYFYSKEATHKYEFSNKGYILNSVVSNPNALKYAFKKGIYKKRRYHGVDVVNNHVPYVIEFKASNENAAISEFTSRKELR